jgi:hypothetical protein
MPFTFGRERSGGAASYLIYLLINEFRSFLNVSGLLHPLRVKGRGLPECGDTEYQGKEQVSKEGEKR